MLIYQSASKNHQQSHVEKSLVNAVFKVTKIKFCVANKFDNPSFLSIGPDVLQIGAH
jgi:hypothetical protein